ncbi:hypothetical protein EDB85DRAFT_2283119 [Lactarius pseudohatsudake]|nr:hypothetical protein EDB85DRAFT_2283119 [Lactarius pseudohatsudake]
MIQSKIAQGLGGASVKRRKWSRRPPRGASRRMRVGSGHRRICVKGVEPRASAAMSGGGTGSVSCRWSETVAHASARHETLYKWPPGSGTRRVQFAKAAHKCGVMGSTGKSKGKSGKA